jgi:tRNA-dihydrouridine synthase
LCQAARIVESETGYAGIDLNIGCPARKVIKKREGGGGPSCDLPVWASDGFRRSGEKSRVNPDGEDPSRLTDVTARETAGKLQDEGIDVWRFLFPFTAARGTTIPARLVACGGIRTPLRIPLIGNGISSM